MVLLRGLSTYLAPFLPFTADEVWREKFGTCIHLEEFLMEEDTWANEDVVTKWARVLEIRSFVTDAIEKQARSTGLIGASLEGSVALTLTEADFSLMDEAAWAELLIVANVDMVQGCELAATVTKATGEKCPRCWTYSNNDHADHACERCEEALSGMSQENVA